MTNNDSQQEGLKRFIWLEKQVRKAKDPKHLAFIITNQTRRLIPFTQAILWKRTPLGISIASVSATAAINHKSPYIVWLERQLIPSFNKNFSDTITLATKENTDSSLHEEWDEFLAPYVVHCPFKKDEDGQIQAGILFIFNEKPSDSLLNLTNELQSIFDYTWSNSIKPAKESKWKKFWEKKNRTKRIWLIALAVLALMFIIPIQQTILSPAEIAPREPILVSSSIDGVIKTVDVKPNQEVAKGQVLFTLDSITLENEYEQAQKALTVAEEKYRRAYQHAYTDAESKSELSVLETEVQKARSELNYTKALLERSRIRAVQAGIIIFSDPKHWLGRPIKVGERVMLLAGVDNKQLNINVPVGDMIQIKKGDKVRFFPNVNPLSALKATIDYASFIAEPQEDQTLSYSVVASFTPNQNVPRYGLHGTAKIYGGYVNLFFYLFRRPIMFMQSLLGI